MKNIHRSDIDGLRGIAVISVILFHAGFNFASGGYSGVDVFFVLSGFLVTQSIKSSIEKKTFTVFGFYERRALRILPAALTVIIIVGFFGSISLFPEEIKELSESCYSFIKLQTNMWAAGSIDYFGISAENKPLIHYWSLAIELQFYVFAPILLSHFLIRRRHKALMACIALVFGASLLYASVYVYDDPNNGYFSSLMRVWQFTLGAIVCLANIENRVGRMRPLLRECLLGLGIAMAIASIAIFDQRSNFPGILSLVPCVGAALILMFGNSETFFGRLLSCRWLTFFGVISFSLYLVHQPIFAYYRTLEGRGLELYETTGSIAVSVVIAFLLYAMVEKPFRRTKSPFKYFGRLYVFTLIAIALTFSYKGINKDLPQYNLASEVEDYLKFRYDNNPRIGECRVGNKVMNPEEACLYGDENLPRVALWGDSHADQIAMPLSEAIERHGFSTLEFAVAGCPPIANVKSPSGRRMCTENTEAILDYLTGQDEINHVFLHAYWTGYFDEGLISPQTVEPGQTTEDAIRDSFEFVVNELTDAGKKVHIIYPVPKMRVNPPLFMARRALGGYSLSNDVISISQSEFKTQSARATTILDKVVDKYGLTAIHLAESLYDEESKIYSAVEGKTILYRDDNHLSIAGGLKVSEAVAARAFESPI